jgi:putative ABC transport system permease protein
MTIWKLVVRNIIFYRRTHIGTVLGTALATMILVGALIVGDSVRYSLQNMVLERLGNTSYSMELDSRNFNKSLADSLARELKTDVVPVLQAKGIATRSKGDQRANRVEVVGVDSQFARITNSAAEFWQLENYEAIINEPLATKLNLKVGNQFLLRLLKSETFSRDAPLSRDTDLTISRRYSVKHIASASEFGKFNLKSSQVTPPTVFVQMEDLTIGMEIEGRANSMLVAERLNKALTAEELNRAVSKHWTLSDVGILLDTLVTKDAVQLKSNRIFLEPKISEAANQSGSNSIPVFTYFVNELRSGSRMTPFSFVSAPGEPLVPSDMQNNEIIINRWLADDLKVRVGDQITVAYYVIGPMRQLIEQTADFNIKSIVPVSGIYADRALMPDFPGLAGEENCRDWDPGIPIDFDLIRNKDEDYWDQYRGTPKAYVTLETAQLLWSNRFGNLTAIRFNDTEIATIELELKNKLNPQDFGLIFRPVKRSGMQASTESVDFAELFLGLSFFIILSAMILTGLLFILSIEQRSQQTGLYLALGFRQKMIQKLVIYESGLLAAVGVLIGGFFGIIYNYLILWALKTIWIDAVGTTDLYLYIDVTSVITGLIASFAIALLTMFLVVRKQGRQSISGLQAGLNISDQNKIIKKSRLSFYIAVIGFFLALAILIFVGAGRGKEAAGAFFATGSILLISGIAFTSYYLTRIQTKPAVTPDLIKIGIRNASRAKTRSLLLVGLLASGLFIVFTVGANRHGAIQNPFERSSGTGGFAFYAQTLMPVLYDLDSEKGREFYGLEELDKAPVSFIPFRVKEGEDASCLNLNRVSTPQLLGINPEKLDETKSFSFNTITDQVDPEKPWSSLDCDPDADVVPGIADETVIIWGLGQSVGDTLEYLDESGNTFRVRLVAGLANSVFQGNIIISTDVLTKRFPSVSGHRLFLIDCPADQMEPVSGLLSWALQDLGIDISSTAERLAGFNKVENTYLSIFLILGGFGLLLGTLGLGIVVIRNILERRGELALLKAIGYSRKSIDQLLLSEHILLLVIGTLCGFLTAIIAVLPAMITPGGDVPYLTIFITLLIILFSGAMWIYLATSFAMKGDLIPALRNE